MKYSLSDLAWLSRGLFRDDFRAELQLMGVENLLAYNLAAHIERGEHMNILSLYQTVIDSSEYTSIIDQYCTYWLTNHKK